MDRRTVLAVVLSLTIYYTWMMIRGPAVSVEEIPVPTPVPAEVVPASVAPVPTDAPVRQVDFEACAIQARVSTDGGGLNHAVLRGAEGPLDITPVYTYVMGLFTGKSEGGWHPYGGEVPPEILVSAQGHGLVAGSGNPAEGRRRFEVVSEGPEGVVLTSVGGDGVEITQRFVARTGGPDCVFDVEVDWTNRTGADLPPGSVWVGMFDDLAAPGGMFAYYVNTENAFARVDGDLETGTWKDPDEGVSFKPVPVEGTTDWIALADRYHGMFAMPVDRTGTTSWARYGSGEGAQDGSIWSPAEGLAAGATQHASLQVYAGSHDTDVMATIDETLVDIVDFGIFAVFAYPLLFALRFIEGFTGNWGMAIVVLTVGVRLLFFPLNQSAFRSMEKMKVIQPLMNEIRETYKDDQEELNKRTMELFKEHKVNPLGGCFPMFIQMPVFLSLFYVLMYSADLYHTEFLYLRDLSSPDPYCVLPSVVVGLMLLQQQLTPTGQMDPAQARMMKFMPLMFGFFWFMFPSGLVVYYFINTGLGILQQWWIRRSLAVAAPQ